MFPFCPQLQSLYWTEERIFKDLTPYSQSFLVQSLNPGDKILRQFLNYVFKVFPLKRCQRFKKKMLDMETTCSVIGAVNPFLSLEDVLSQNTGPDQVILGILSHFLQKETIQTIIEMLPLPDMAYN